jgi:DNA repair exonuclease SbcCD ATPase subunit
MKQEKQNPEYELRVEIRELKREIEQFKQTQRNVEACNQKLCELKHELGDEGVAHHIAILQHEDSDAIIAVCESIGVHLIPIKGTSTPLFLEVELLKQLNEEMEYVK